MLSDDESGLRLEIQAAPTGDAVGSYREHCRDAARQWEDGRTVDALLALGRALEVAHRWQSYAFNQDDTPAHRSWSRRVRWVESLAAWARDQGSPDQMWRHEPTGTILRRRWHPAGMIVTERLEATSESCTWHEVGRDGECICGGVINEGQNEVDAVIRECEDCGLRLYRREAE